MKEKHLFLTPDYFSEFSCKMGACRHACCEGWPISFSLESYFHLINLDCSAELKEKLERGIHIALRPTPDRYAEISPKYDGNCPLRLPDGRCSLHAEVGEDSLSEVCRLYPRGIRCEDGYEASCANSCEAVTELLFSRREPLRFVRREAELELPEEANRRFSFETLGRGQEIRLWFIAQLQERTLSLPQRLMKLGRRMFLAEDVLKRKDNAALSALLSESFTEAPEPPVPVVPDKELQAAEILLQMVDEESGSLCDYGREVLKQLKRGPDAYQCYLAEKTDFEHRFPEWERFYENLLVNHMFFSDFPFQDRPESFREEFMALCVIYVLLRILGIGWCECHGKESDLIDVCAAAFRLIDHTDFDRYAVFLLKQIGLDTMDQVLELIML